MKMIHGPMIPLRKVSGRKGRLVEIGYVFFIEFEWAAAGLSTKGQGASLSSCHLPKNRLIYCPTFHLRVQTYWSKRSASVASVTYQILHNQKYQILNHIFTRETMKKEWGHLFALNLVFERLRDFEFSFLYWKCIAERFWNILLSK